jgi:hypothetical protein
MSAVSTRSYHQIGPPPCIVIPLPLLRLYRCSARTPGIRVFVEFDALTGMGPMFAMGALGGVRDGIVSKTPRRYGQKRTNCHHNYRQVILEYELAYRILHFLDCHACNYTPYS